MARQAVELTGKSSRFIILASVCLVVAALYFASEILIPLSVATLLAFLLTPLVTRLERLGLGRATSSVLVVLLMMAALSAIGWIVGKQFVVVIKQLPEYRSAIQEKSKHMFQSFMPVQKVVKDIAQVTSAPPATAPAASQPATAGTSGGASDGNGTGAALPGPVSSSHRLTDGPTGRPAPPATEPSAAATPVPVTIIPPPSTPWEAAAGYLGKLLDPLATAGLVIVFVIFMLITREDLRDRILRLVGHGRLNVTTQALDEAGDRITRYLVAQSIVNLSYGALVSAGLWLIGLTLGRRDSGPGFPNVLLWGLLCTLLRFVPYVGIWIAAALPIALSFALFNSNTVFFATVAMFVAYEIVVSQFVEPYLYGASTGMSAMAVLVSAVFWTWLWGPIGLLLSTPLTVCLVVMGKYVPQLRFLDILLGDEPVLEPHVRIYQRLLAMDQEEAAELAHEYLKTRSLEQLYDEVLIPALILAERDGQHDKIDAERHRFVRQSMRDLVEELGDQQRASDLRAAAAATEQIARDGVATADTAAPPRPARPSLPKDCSVTVLCFPAHDESDEIAGMMLAQLLSMRGYCAEAVGEDTLAGEMVELVEQKKPDVVCVSALPPAAVAHARYVCKRLHARFPDLKMLIGLWALQGDVEKARQRITCVDSVVLVTSLAQAQDQIEQLSHAAMMAASATPEANQLSPAT